MKKYKADDKATLIKLARKEIKEYQAVIDDAKGQIEEWRVFIKNIENAK